jgi:hypothetical protein
LTRASRCQSGDRTKCPGQCSAWAALQCTAEHAGGRSEASPVDSRVAGRAQGRIHIGAPRVMLPPPLGPAKRSQRVVVDRFPGWIRGPRVLGRTSIGSKPSASLSASLVAICLFSVASTFFGSPVRVLLRSRSRASATRTEKSAANRSSCQQLSNLSYWLHRMLCRVAQ